MRIWVITIVLALGLAACDRPPERPPMPKTGETVTNQGEQAPAEHR